MERHIAAFDASYNTLCVLHPPDFFQVLTEAMNRLREHDPKVRKIYEKVLYAGTGHRQYNKNKDMNLAVLVHLNAIDEKTYSKIKHRKRRPSHRTIVGICLVLGLNVETMNGWFIFAGDIPPDYHLRKLYEFLICSQSSEQKSIAFCNQILEHYGYEEEYQLGV